MKIVMFDCDSTLVDGEGIDMLAEFVGVGDEIQSLTQLAMEGKIAFEDIYTKRLEIIQPTIYDMEKVSLDYQSKILPSAFDTVKSLMKNGFEVGILSGGFISFVREVAKLLGIKAEMGFAVKLEFDSDGNYEYYSDPSNLSTNGGKLEVIRSIKKHYSPSEIYMVGDGVTDLEVKNEVDGFIGFGGICQREKVKSEAEYYIEEQDLTQVIKILESL